MCDSQQCAGRQKNMAQHSRCKDVKIAELQKCEERNEWVDEKSMAVLI